MRVAEITEKSTWEDFFSGREEKTFLQSWDWGEFQIKSGNKIWRLGLYGEKGLLSLVLAAKVRARRGTFLLVQHCLDVREELVGRLKEIAEAEGCLFIRMAPLLPRSEENQKVFQKLGFREAPMHANAYEATWRLDLTPPEETLLKNMRKSTRYLIHQAEKNHELAVAKSGEPADAQIYQKLSLKVAKRQQFTPFSYEFVRNEFEIFSRDKKSLFFFGKYRGEVVASALVIFWSGIGFYHQAALDPQYHRIPVAYLLQWEAIREAKKRGCRFYDFWGYVDPKSRHPWAGPTLFKMGFGGEARLYMKTQDLPLSWKYWPVLIFETLRKIKRGL